MRHDGTVESERKLGMMWVGASIHKRTRRLLLVNMMTSRPSRKDAVKGVRSLEHHQTRNQPSSGLRPPHRTPRQHGEKTFTALLLYVFVKLMLSEFSERKTNSPGARHQR